MRTLRGSLAFLLLSQSLTPLLEARNPAFAKNGMVVAEEPIAADVGVEVLKRGGNAVDAAVAVGFALAVTHPTAGNIGGGGFLLVRFADGRTAFLDFRERAPEKSSRNMYLDASGKATRDSMRGWRASGVPGTPKGLELAHRKWGKLKWSELLEPSVRLARDGFPVSYLLARSLKESKVLAEQPETKRIFQKDGAFWNPGDTLRQPDLATVLQRLAEHGSKDFYEGETARKMAAEMARHGGLITYEDLKNYQAVERAPLTGRYRGYDIVTAPPPSSGGVGLLQMLGILEGSPFAKYGAGSANAIHWAVEAMRRYYADRSQHMGDPDFYKVPVKALLDPEYIRQRRSSIDEARASGSNAVKPGSVLAGESTETTHFSIVDKDGNAVSLTYTLNGSYGSGVTVPGLGILMNNEMDDFAAKPGEANMFGLVQGEANAIAPRKRPLSSMTPTIVTRNGKLFLVVGGPGGGRIITSVLQVFVNIVDFGLNVQDAIDRPRFHHQWQPDKITIEPGFSPDTIRLLEGKGHTVETSSSVARIEAIVVDQNGWLQGGADGRGAAKASGY